MWPHFSTLYALFTKISLKSAKIGLKSSFFQGGGSIRCLTKGLVLVARNIQPVSFSLYRDPLGGVVHITVAYHYTTAGPSIHHQGQLQRQLQGQLQRQLQGQLRGQLQRQLQGQLQRQLKGKLKGQLKKT